MNEFQQIKQIHKFSTRVEMNAGTVDVIGDFIKEQHPHLTLRAADAMALAIIYSTYLQLVFEEEGEMVIPFEEVEQYIWAANDKKTLH